MCVFFQFFGGMWKTIRDRAKVFSGNLLRIKLSMFLGNGKWGLVWKLTAKSVVKCGECTKVILGAVVYLFSIYHITFELSNLSKNDLQQV